MALFIRCVSWLVGCLPASLQIGLGCLLGWGLRRVVRFRRNVVRQQMQTALGPETAAAIEPAVYRHIGLTAIELLRQPALADEKLEELIKFDGLEHLEKALEQGRGVLALSGHMGNWELPLPMVNRHGPEMYVVYKELKHAAGETFRRMIRDDRGVHGISRHGAARGVLKALKKNAMVGFVLDQNMTADEGVFVDFFGMPACTMPGLAVLAERSGAVVLPVCCHRAANDWHHHMRFGAPIELESGGEDSNANAHANTARFTLELERMIQERPAQWIWMHKRWKTRPPDEAKTPINFST